ncbi:hypothetical protein [Kordiimonas pumila]|uniref:Uncharacterized protein n=1 Tax=Kordiimonas pumila TaxID=2161677 RepID=A0ABV7D2W3_9PROT|nr:hypothetical protein [Kordiimonas pumila]
MQDPIQQPHDHNRAFRAKRRQLLRMGAAGMPMVLTLRASASEAIISQLRCMFTIPSNLKILVDSEGQAWVGDASIQQGANGMFVSDVQSFKDGADYVFPAGSVPESYRPDACSSNSNQCGDDDGWGWGDDDDDGGSNGHGHGHGSNSLTYEYAASGSDEHGYYAADNMGRTYGGSHGNGNGNGHGNGNSGDDDDDSGHGSGDDDCGESEWVDCGYTLYTYGSNHSISVADYVNDQGNWTLSGDDGLFLTLSMIYADSYGGAGSWPGISCIVSVLTYLGQ